MCGSESGPGGPVRCPPLPAHRRQAWEGSLPAKAYGVPSCMESLKRVHAARAPRLACASGPGMPPPAQPLPLLAAEWSCSAGA